MTKEQFYRNCLTSEGREENNQEFTNLKSLKQYYKKDIDINDLIQWNEIVYIQKYGKIQLENEFTGEQEEDYGEIKPQQDWGIYTMWDILNTIIYTYEKVYNQRLSITEYMQKTKELYNLLNGGNINEIIALNGI